MEWLMSGGKVQKWAQTKPKVMQDVKKWQLAPSFLSRSAANEILKHDGIQLIWYVIKTACKIMLKMVTTDTNIGLSIIKSVSYGKWTYIQKSNFLDYMLQARWTCL